MRIFLWLFFTAMFGIAIDFLLERIEYKDRNGIILASFYLFVLLCDAVIARYMLLGT